MRKSVIWNMIWLILIALAVAAKNIGCAIFKAKENPDGTNGTNGTIFDMFNKVKKEDK